VSSKDPYDGPSVDIFAMGVLLFIMKYKNYPWGEAGDNYYDLFQNNIEKYCEKRSDLNA